MVNTPTSALLEMAVKAFDECANEAELSYAARTIKAIVPEDCRAIVQDIYKRRRAQLPQFASV